MIVRVSSVSFTSLCLSPTIRAALFCLAIVLLGFPPESAIAKPIKGDNTGTAQSDTTTEDTIKPAVEGKTTSREMRSLPSLYFGLQMHSMMSGVKEHRRSATAAVELGASFVRDECYWGIVEKEKGVYRIPEEPLENFRTNRALGLETLLILDYMNALYDDGNAPTSDEALNAFAGYCRHMAETLKGVCNYFEVWNEPNTDGFWRPKKDAAAYGHLMEAAIRGVREGNPDAVVFGGTLAGIDGEFMRAVCNAADCTAMDVFSMHPYCTPRSPGDADIFNRMYSLQMELFPHAESRPPIWVTEIGYPTNEMGGVSEWRQSEAIAQTYLLGATRPELLGVVWYWMGPDGPDAQWAEDRFGLIRPGFSGWKPSGCAFRSLSEAMKGVRVETGDESIEGIEGSRVIRMRKPDGSHLTAVYLESGETAVDVFGPDAVEVWPLTGATSETLMAPEGGTIQITANPMPVLLKSEIAPVFQKATRPFFLYSRFGRLPKGGHSIWSVATRGTLTPSQPSIVNLWPGSLRPEIPPDSTPWVVRSLGEGNEAAMRISTPGKTQPQVSRVAAYYTPPGAAHPSMRLVGTLEVSDPLALDMKGFLNDEEEPMVEVTVENRTDDGVNADVRISVQGEQEKLWKLKNLAIGEKKTFRMAVNRPNAPDAVLEVKVEAEMGSDVKVGLRDMISFFPCYRMPSAIAVDGNLSDWPSGRPAIRLGYRNQLTAEREPWGGGNDASARVWMAWDETWLYLAAEIFDDVHVEESSGFTMYNNDGLEVYIDTDRAWGRTQETYGDHQFQYGLFPTMGKDVVFDFHYTQQPSRDSQIVINRAPSREQLLDASSSTNLPSLLIEATLPMTELKLEPKAGLEIGFTIALDDDDSPGSTHPFSQDLQMQWARQRNAWQRPAAFGSVWLKGEFPNTP